MESGYKKCDRSSTGLVAVKVDELGGKRWPESGEHRFQALQPVLHRGPYEFSDHGGGVELGVLGDVLRDLLKIEVGRIRSTLLPDPSG